MERPSPPQTEELNERELEARLIAAGVPIETWGQGSAKTVAHLLDEVNSGEARLLTGANGEIIREVSVVFVEVFVLDDEHQLRHLREDRQVFSDGRERKRSMLSSLSEKMLPEEAVAAATKRAVAEELGIKEVVNFVYLGSKQTANTSISYPGLESRYNGHKTVVMLPTTAYKPEGYTEEQPDKTTYFVWDHA